MLLHALALVKRCRIQTPAGLRAGDFVTWRLCQSAGLAGGRQFARTAVFGWRAHAGVPRLPDARRPWSFQGGSRTFLKSRKGSGNALARRTQKGQVERLPRAGCRVSTRRVARGLKLLLCDALRQQRRREPRWHSQQHQPVVTPTGGQSRSRLGRGRPRPRVLIQMTQRDDRSCKLR
jgi:hypothetical protein